jgi:hypothetical protein
MLILMLTCLCQASFASPAPWSDADTATHTRAVEIQNQAAVYTFTPDILALNTSVTTLSNFTQNSSLNLLVQGQLQDFDDNGLDVGDRLNYTITVTNVGVTSLTNLTPTSSRPELQNRNFTLGCSGQPLVAYGVSQFEQFLGNASESFYYSSIGDDDANLASLLTILYGIYPKTNSSTNNFHDFPEWLQQFYVNFDEFYHFFTEEIFNNIVVLNDTELTVDQNATFINQINEIAATFDQTDPSVFEPINITALGLNATTAGFAVKIFSIIRNITVTLRAFNGNTVPVTYQPASLLPLSMETEQLTKTVANLAHQALVFILRYMPHCDVSCYEVLMDPATYAEPNTGEATLRPGQHITCSYAVDLTQQRVDHGIVGNE